MVDQPDFQADDRNSADKMLAKRIADPDDFKLRSNDDAGFVFELASEKQEPAKKQKK